jgi:hypothetical protein
MEGNGPNEGPADSVIRFACNFCGQRIRVPKSYAGKKGKCPKCKNAIIVPSPVPSSAKSAPAKTDTPKPAPFTDLLLQKPPKPEPVAAPQPELTKDMQFEILRQSAGLSSLQLKPPPRRKHPWLIDIFLYPANLHGLIFFVIAVLIPLLISIVSLCLGIFAGFIAIPSIIINTVIAMYAYWYLAQCVRDSAFGGIRAPDTLAETPGLGELLWQVLQIAACLVVYLAPALVYHRFTNRNDLTFWLLASCGVFIYPMALLAVIMFDSLNGLNPIIAIPSIFSVFFQYCGLIIIIGAIVFLYVQMIKSIPANPLLRLVASPIIRTIGLYLIMVAAHLLGRFYCKYQVKLNWEV